MHLEYPKWVKVDGPGHPHNPGFVLVETEDQEREVLAGGEAPRDLNPEAYGKATPEGEKTPLDAKNGTTKPAEKTK